MEKKIGEKEIKEKKDENLFNEDKEKPTFEEIIIEEMAIDGICGVY